jgi:hypothetical protein
VDGKQRVCDLRLAASEPAVVAGLKHDVLPADRGESVGRRS